MSGVADVPMLPLPPAVSETPALLPVVSTLSRPSPLLKIEPVVAGPPAATVMAVPDDPNDAVDHNRPIVASPVVDTVMTPVASISLNAPMLNVLADNVTSPAVLRATIGEPAVPAAKTTALFTLICSTPPVTLALTVRSPASTWSDMVPSDDRVPKVPAPPTVMLALGLIRLNLPPA